MLGTYQILRAGRDFNAERLQMQPVQYTITRAAISGHLLLFTADVQVWSSVVLVATLSPRGITKFKNALLREREREREHMLLWQGRTDKRELLSLLSPRARFPRHSLITFRASGARARNWGLFPLPALHTLSWKFSVWSKYLDKLLAESFQERFEVNLSRNL